MEQSTLSVRINKDDKQNFETFCNQTGMNVSTAINMFIKAVIREQKLPFEIKTNSFDNEVYSKLHEAEIEMTKTKRRYNSEEVFNELEQKLDN